MLKEILGLYDLLQDLLDPGHLHRSLRLIRRLENTISDLFDARTRLLEIPGTEDLAIAIGAQIVQTHAMLGAAEEIRDQILRSDRGRGAVGALFRPAKGEREEGPHGAAVEPLAGADNGARRPNLGRYRIN